MNGLHDTNMINALYDASEAGVHIDLIVRGINCLVPNQPYSRNIRMIRIIDSYLEHARIWYFYAGGHEDMYLSSADWMLELEGISADMLHPSNLGHSLLAKGLISKIKSIEKK